MKKTPRMLLHKWGFFCVRLTAYVSAHSQDYCLFTKDNIIW